MKKRTLSFILALVMCLSLLPMTAMAAGDPFQERFFPSGTPTALGTSYIDIDNAHSSDVTGYLPIPDDLNAFMIYDDTTEDWEDQLGLYTWYVWFQSDVAVDSPTAWLSTAQWDAPENGVVDNAAYEEAAQVWGFGSTNKLEEAGLFDLYYENARAQLAGGTVSDSERLDEYGEPYVLLDTANHTFYFRQRYVIAYEYENDYGNWHHLIAPWSSTVSIGKNGTQQPLTKPTKLDAPVISGLVVTPPDAENGEKQASIQYNIAFPKSVNNAWMWYQVNDRYFDTGDLEGQINVDNKGWQGIYTANSTSLYDGERSTSSSEAITKSSHVQFRVRLSGGEFTSPWSNVLEVNSPTWNASDWAKPYAEKADEYGLIPDCLAGADLTQPITRAEFAAVAVKLYEAMSGKTSEPVAANPFTDTTDAEILKAYNVGIINGLSSDRFGPVELVTREQAATMLTRAYKATYWDGWTLETDGTYTANTLDNAGVAPFADDAKISAWAKPSVYFMVKNKIIDGVGNNLFAPNTANIPAGAAVNYGQATREAALKIAVVSYENLGK